MFARLKRRILPKEHRPAFEPHERVLAWAMASSDEAVIATNLGLWVGGSRTRWSDISKAVWDGGVLTITPSSFVGERDGYSVIRDLPPLRLALVEPGHLPHQIRLRVTSSVRHSAHHELSRGGVWIAARRVPGVDGLSWVARYDPGTDGEDPEVSAETEVVFRETCWKIVGGAG